MRFGARPPPTTIDHLEDGYGDIDYFYQRDVILVRTGFLDAVQRILRDVFDATGEPVRDGSPFRELTLLSIAATRVGVPRVLDVIDERRPRIRPARPPVIATPHHVLSVTQPNPVPHCPATEPQEVAGTAKPRPGVCPTSQDGDGVRVYVPDTGFILGADTAHSWLAGVKGDVDAVVGGNIEAYVGHGTFIAGVARCMAPAAQVTVEQVFAHAGANLELDIVRRLNEALLIHNPHVVSLSAGATTRHDLELLGFEPFWDQLRQRGDVVLVAAAGNSGSNRKFWPAALPDAMVISVGALTANQQRRARFSDFGPWVKVYARGARLVNAFATGDYICKWPPNKGKHRHFAGMARWSGTSFSTPLVAGLIAARKSRTGEDAPQAAQALLAQASAHPLHGVGPVLYPCLDANDK